MTTQNLANAGGDASASSVRGAAERYLAEGWAIVPIPHRSKRPVDAGWNDPTRSYKPADITGNVGVILGPRSNHLADLDLDSHWALKLAPHFLPKTATFGRKSKRRSHWLYYCEGLRNRKFTFAASLEQTGRAVELVELRAQNAANDRCSQTVFPDSTHESGEAIEWDEDSPDEIATIERGDLIWRTTRLAVASIVADGWEEGTQRNAKTMHLAGGLLQARWTADEVRQLFEAVFEVAEVDDEQATKDLGAVERTIVAFESGATVTGFGSLVTEGLVDANVVRRVEHHCRTPDTLATEIKIAGTVAGRQIRDRLVRERQDTDGLVAAEDKFVAEISSEAASTGAAANDTSSAPDPFSVLGVDTGLDAACEDLDWLVEGLQLAPGKVSLITAYAGGGKTPMACLLSVCVAGGVACLEHPVKRARVLYLATEGARNARRKIIRIALGLGLNARQLEADGWLKILDAHPLNDSSCAHLETIVRSAAIGLVIVDTITSALRDSSVGRNEEAYARLLFELGPVSERTRCVVLGLAHDNKSASGVDLRGTSGSSAIVEAAATVIRLEPSPEDDKLIRVSCARAPDERFPAFGVRWVDGSGSVGATARGRTGDVSLPLRCLLDEGAIADRRGANSTNAARASEKAEAMLTAAPRVLGALKELGNGDMKQLRAAAGDVSQRVLNEVLARLKKANAVRAVGNFHSLTNEWNAWPAPALQARVQSLMTVMSG